MAKFNINDKVSFINEKQNGIVKAIKPNGICIVEIEDGFEIDVQESELVLIKNVKEESRDAGSKEKENIKTTPSFIQNLTNLEEGIWIVSSPAEDGQVLTGPADFYIINKSRLTVLAAVSLKKGNNLNGLAAVIVHPKDETYITKLNRNDVDMADDWYIQLLFYNKGEFSARSTLTKEAPVVFPDLSSANGKLPQPYAFCKTILISSTVELTEDQTQALLNKYSAGKIEEAMFDKTNLNTNKKTEKTSDLEVDLHIEKLTTNYAGLSNSEMLDIQINHFHKKLDEALYKKAWKIIFIHGAGNGSLKAAIRKDLTEQNIKFTDGRYDKYGGGATEVIL